MLHFWIGNKILLVIFKLQDRLFLLLKASSTTSYSWLCGGQWPNSQVLQLCKRETRESSQNSLPYRPFQLNLKKASPRHMFSLLLPASGITSHPKDRPLDGLPRFQALFSPAHPLCCQFSLSTNATVSSLSYVFQCHHSTCRSTSLALTSPRSCHNAAQATPPPRFPEDALSSLNTSAPPSPSWPTLLPDILFIFQSLDSDRMPLC